MLGGDSLYNSASKLYRWASEAGLVSHTTQQEYDGASSVWIGRGTTVGRLDNVTLYSLGNWVDFYLPSLIYMMREFPNINTSFGRSGKYFAHPTLLPSQAIYMRPTLRPS
jgi:hypothetical protein